MRKEFEVHLLNEQGIVIAKEMGERFSDLLEWLHIVGEPCSELTLAGRKLEEACFYGKKSMAQKAENQK